MEDLKTKARDLLDCLKALQSGGYIAQVTIINNCPPDWGVVIVAGGVKFFYTDGSDYTDGPRTINLSSGQSATFSSNDANKCVHQFFSAITVAVPNEPAQNFTDQDGVPQGQCLVHESVVLGPKQSVSKKTGKISEALQLTRK